MMPTFPWRSSVACFMYFSCYRFTNGLLDTTYQKDRNQPLCALLIVGVGRVGGDSPLPPDGAFLDFEFPGDAIERLGAVLEHHLRVRLDVVVPNRVLGGSAERGDHRVVAIVLNAHEGSLTHL